MVRKCSFLRNFVGQRWSVVERGSERFALVPAPSDQTGPMHDLGYELLTAGFSEHDLSRMMHICGLDEGLV